MRTTQRCSVLVNLQCIECGAIFPIQRRNEHRKKVNKHIKTLYCINCRKVTKHLEKKYP
ncbi:MAG: hypothetical protein RR136_02505 [Clostridia bacterium]